MATLVGMGHSGLVDLESTGGSEKTNSGAVDSLEVNCSAFGP